MNKTLIFPLLILFLCTQAYSDQTPYITISPNTTNYVTGQYYVTGPYLQNTAHWHQLNGVGDWAFNAPLVPDSNGSYTTGSWQYDDMHTNTYRYVKLTLTPITDWSTIRMDISGDLTGTVYLVGDYTNYGIFTTPPTNGQPRIPDAYFFGVDNGSTLGSASVHFNSPLGPGGTAPPGSTQPLTPGPGPGSATMPDGTPTTAPDAIMHDNLDRYLTGAGTQPFTTASQIKNALNVNNAIDLFDTIPMRIAPGNISETLNNWITEFWDLRQQLVTKLDFACLRIVFGAIFMTGCIFTCLWSFTSIFASLSGESGK